MKKISWDTIELILGLSITALFIIWLFSLHHASPESLEKLGETRPGANCVSDYMGSVDCY